MIVLNTIDKYLTMLLRFVLGMSSLVIFVVTFAAVVFRYLLHAPLPWSQDVIRLGFTYMIYFGAAYCVRENANLNIDVGLSLLSKRKRILVEILINIILFGFFIFLLVFGLQFAETGISQTSSYLMLPMKIYYMGIPLSGAFMAFYVVMNIIKQIKRLANKEGGEEAC